MKILVIGDPHGSPKIKSIPIKDIDLILLTGDLGKADLLRKLAFDKIKRENKGLPEKEYSDVQQKRAFMQAYNSSIKTVKYLSKFAPVYTIFGNVEYSNAETRKLAKQIGVKLPLLTKDLNALSNVRVINNKVVRFNRVRIGGLGYFVDANWVQEFKPEDYLESLESAKEKTGKVKKILSKFGKVDILLCHQPPYGILDKVTAPYAPKHWKGKHAGSKTILSYIKRKQPNYVFCGHIHEGEGRKKIGKTEIFNLGCAGSYLVINVE